MENTCFVSEEIVHCDIYNTSKQ